MLASSRAIVLNSTRYGDGQVVVNLLTEANGRVPCIVRVPSSPRAALKRQYFQPITLLDVVLDIRPLSSLHKVREARVSIPLNSLHMDPRKLAICMFLAEFIGNATRREEADGALFRYVESAIRWLDGCGAGFANFHLVLMMRLTRFLGFYPNVEGYVPGDWFDLLGACFSREKPLHGAFLAPREARHVALMLRMDFPTMHLFRMSRRERDRLAEVIIGYYGIHVPGFPRMRSLGVLRELFS